MKKLIVLFVCLTLIGSTSAQLFRVGFRGGMGSSSIKMDDLNISSSSIGSSIDSLLIKAGDAKVGLHFGVITRIKILSLYVQPELLLTSANCELKVSDLLDGTESIKDQKFTKLDIPIMIGWKLGPARIQAGPVANIIINSDKALDSYDLEEEYKGATWGYQVGAGLDLWKLTFDVKYEGNFSKLGDSVKLGSESFNTDMRNKQVIFSVGFWLK